MELRGLVLVAAVLLAGCATASVVSERLPGAEDARYRFVRVEFEGADDVLAEVVERAMDGRSPALVRDTAGLAEPIGAVLTVSLTSFYTAGGGRRRPPQSATAGGRGVRLSAPETGQLRGTLVARLTDVRTGRAVWTASAKAKADGWDAPGHRMLGKAAEELARRLVEDGLIDR